VTLVVIGEILWDVFDNAEKLGGAPFNFAAHAARLGHRVVLLSAVGDDARGRLARERAADLGLPAEFIQVAPDAPTGSVRVRVAADGQPDFTIHRPAAYDALHLDDPLLSRLALLSPDWLYFGSLYPFHPEAHRQLARLTAVFPNARRFFDVNLRRDCYTPQLTLDLLRSAHVVKLNQDEAERIDGFAGIGRRSVGAFTSDWTRRCGLQAIAVTRGAAGAAIRIGEQYAEVPGYAVDVADAVGSGDAFAAALLHGLAEDWSVERIGDFANRVGALVASRPGGAPEWTVAEALALVRRA
jgi:fructokinase